MRAAFALRRYRRRPSPGVNANFVSGDSGNPGAAAVPRQCGRPQLREILGHARAMSRRSSSTNISTPSSSTRTCPTFRFDLPASRSPAYRGRRPIRPCRNYLPPQDHERLHSAPYNVKGGKMYGVELGSDAAVRRLHSMRSTASASPAASATPKSKIHICTTARRRRTCRAIRSGSPNGTLYFEKWGFNVRGSVASPVELHRRGVGLCAQTASPERKAGDDRRRADRLRLPAGQLLSGPVDLSAGPNLTNEPFVTDDASGNPTRIIDYQRLRPPLDARRDVQVRRPRRSGRRRRRRLRLRLRRLRRRRPARTDR